MSCIFKNFECPQNVFTSTPRPSASAFPQNVVHGILCGEAIADNQPGAGHSRTSVAASEAMKQHNKVFVGPQAHSLPPKVSADTQPRRNAPLRIEASLLVVASHRIVQPAVTVTRSMSPTPTALRVPSSLEAAAWKPPQSLANRRFSPHPPNDLLCWHSQPKTNLVQRRKHTRRPGANRKYHSWASQHSWDGDPIRSTIADRDTTLPHAPPCFASRLDVGVAAATTAPAMPPGPRDRSCSCDRTPSVHLGET